MNKSEVCVKLTRKNCKKVLGILETFGEEVYFNTKEWLAVKDIEYPYINFDSGSWSGSYGLEVKTLVKPRELRDILAREHLKVGDVVVLRNSDGEKIGRVIESTTECIFIKDMWDDTWTGDFLRYATDEEKAFLEPKKVQVTEWSPQVDKGFISQAEQDGFKLHQTYTHEVWVNHYSDQEFHVHKKKSTADHLIHLNGNLGRRVQTIKATLTYDIPMTKV